jgi:dCMP deaminase
MNWDKWDIRFLRIAREVSTWSKDPSTQTGAVIVRPDKSLCSVGFNGFPQNMPDLPEYYANREEKYSRIVHCEINARAFSRDQGHEGYILYTWPFSSCDRCAVEMLQNKIARFVWPQASEDVMSRWAASIERTKRYYSEAGVEQVEVPQEELAKFFSPEELAVFRRKD